MGGTQVQVGREEDSQLAEAIFEATIGEFETREQRFWSKKVKDHVLDDDDDMEHNTGNNVNAVFSMTDWPASTNMFKES